MKELKNLIKVKSLVTISFTIVLCYLAILEKVNIESILNIYLIIIGFYFGTQTEKKKEE